MQNQIKALALTTLAFAVSVCIAQEPAAVQAMRMEPGEAVNMSGDLSADVWKRAPVFKDFTENQPRRGQVARAATRVQLVYDERALYARFEADDAQPEQIRAPLKRHDGVNRTQDFVTLFVDAVGAKRSAQYFRVNAAGSTADGLYTAENDNEDFSPDFEWDSGVTRTAQGYVVVMRVPYASLRDTGAGEGQWRVMMGRRTPREALTLDLSVPLAREALSFIDNMQRLQGFQPPVQQNYWQLRSTLTVRRNNESDSSGFDEQTNKLGVSFDLKWRPIAPLVVDATFKPDFSQVELDTPQLSRNSQFSLYTPEKRPFFLESSDLLVSPTDALYTRSVSDPIWGTRASWRGEAVVGTALLMRDRGGGQVLIPGAYGNDVADQPAYTGLMSRARYERADSSLGAVLSQRDYGQEQGKNTVLGFDGQTRLGDSWRAKLQGMWSSTSALKDANGALSMGQAQRGAKAYFSLYGRSDRTETTLELEDVSQGFRNDSGFVTEAGVRRFNLEQNLQWHELGAIQELQAFVNLRAATDRDNGAIVSQSFEPGVYLSAGRNTEAVFKLYPIQRMRLSADGPLLTQRFVHLWGQTTPAMWAPQVEAWADFGQFVDSFAARARPGRKFGFSGKLRPMERLEFEPRWERLQLHEFGQRAYVESAAQMLAVWHFSAGVSLRIIAQRSYWDHAGEPQFDVAADSGSANTQSLTLTVRRSASSVLYVGATRGTSDWRHLPREGWQRGSELFVKWQTDLGELVRRI